VSFVDREYPDIVRDVLTNLTQGVTQEIHTVADYDPKARPVQVPDIALARRPVRRVSFVGGFIAGAKPDDPLAAHIFTLNDYELVADRANSKDLTTIRFLPFGRKPAPGTNIVVNYYPRASDPTPLTDLNVGSVARTLMEAISKEIALLYAQLNRAYDDAYVETATGAALNRVVALLGYSRFRAGRAVGTVTFTRRAGSPGDITIPAGTPITDAADKIRYETTETHEMRAGESAAEVRVRGATDGTPVVDAGVLSVIQRVIAGLDKVTNERPTTRATADETDDELRSRAEAALIGASTGTVEALTYGLLQLPQVRDAKVEEMPNGVPGEIRIAVSLAQPGANPDGLPPEVAAQIERLRPAGIRVVPVTAKPVSIQIGVQLVLAGSGLAATELEQVHEAVRKVLADEIHRLGVGQKVRVRPLTAKLLADPRIADAVLTIGTKDGAAGQAGGDFDTPAGTTVDLADVGFAADTFSEARPAGQKVPVEVRVAVTLDLLAGTVAADAKTTLSAKLTQFFGSLNPGTSVDAAMLLTAARDDAHYAVDPLKLKVTLTAGAEFVQIVQGGASFVVKPEHAFTIAAVEVST